jgi:hypothetical protein
MPFAIIKSARARSRTRQAVNSHKRDREAWCKEEERGASATHFRTGDGR